MESRTDASSPLASKTIKPETYPLVLRVAYRAKRVRPLPKKWRWFVFYCEKKGGPEITQTGGGAQSRNEARRRALAFIVSAGLNWSNAVREAIEEKHKAHG